MNAPSVTLLDSWPQPSTVAEAVVHANERTLRLRYQAQNESVAVITFPLVSIFQFGAPNDEALGGHPLTKLGLKFYSVHKVENSPWVQELEKRNSVHPQHNRTRFMKDKVHYVFTFQDSTLDLVANEGEYWKPQIQICPSASEAEKLWHDLICG